jgi:ATP-dependent DNA helicase RecQ
VTPSADALADDVFGFKLTTAQRSAIAALIEARDTLAVLPTGSGKSAIYQLAGLLRGGLTVVVSPLIALQRDQLQALSLRPGADGAPVQVAVLNSAQPVAQRADSLRRLRSGTLDFLMLGPEQLANTETHRELLATPRAVTLLAVDEAHLVSEWGHDFRPEYLRLGETAQALGRPPIVALTATASPPVQADITRQLAMRTPAVIVADFDRPNINLTVRRVATHLPEDQAIADRAVEVVIDQATPALVYAMSHARCEEIAARLQQVSLRASAYHAGMGARQRADVQDAFFVGRLDVVVATSAFGMGIDKHDVRTVVHAGVAASLDEYYQEIGRAGRDALPAKAILVYDPRSLRIPRLFAARSRIPQAQVQAVTRTLAGATGPMSLAELTRASGVSRHAAERIADELSELGLLAIDDNGIAPLPTTLSSSASEQVVDAGNRRQAVLGSRIDSMRHYAETVHCRRAELLGYFGEALEPPCDNCDNDAAFRPTVGLTAAPSGSAHPVAGTPVIHRLWGPGTLLSRDEHELVVSFESVGYRHLTPAALTNGLLRLAASALWHPESEQT